MPIGAVTGQSTGSVLTQCELRTLTPTDVRSGLTAKSTLVGPWLLKPARMSLFAWRDEFLECCDAEAVVAPDAPQRCAFILSDHNCGQIVVEACRPRHCGRVSSDVVDDDNGDRTCGFRVGDFLAEGARPAVDDREFTGSARIDAGATVRLSVEQIKGRPQAADRSHQLQRRSLFRRRRDTLKAGRRNAGLCSRRQ